MYRCIYCMFYITLLLCFTATFLTAGALNAQDRIDQLRICFYCHHKVTMILGSKKYRNQDLQVAIRLVVQFKIVRNTAKVFHHGLVAVVTEQV